MLVRAVLSKLYMKKKLSSHTSSRSERVQQRFLFLAMRKRPNHIIYRNEIIYANSIVCSIIFSKADMFQELNLQQTFNFKQLQRLCA